MKILPIVAAAALTATFSFNLPAHAGNGDCGQPLSTGAIPSASDALFVLRTAVGVDTCDLEVCDVDSSCRVTASDALRILRAAVGQGVTLNCSGCGPSTTTTSTTTTTTIALTSATWSEVFAILQDNGCGNANCHGLGFSNALLGNLDKFDAGYDALVGAASSQNPALQRVNPFNPDLSYLINKLEGTQIEAGGTLGRMPSGLPPLSPAQIATIRSWILAGALKN